jgi:hypothetical protein
MAGSAAIGLQGKQHVRHVGGLRWKPWVEYANTVPSNDANLHLQNRALHKGETGTMCCKRGGPPTA